MLSSIDERKNLNFHIHVDLRQVILSQGSLIIGGVQIPQLEIDQFLAKQLQLIQKLFLMDQRFLSHKWGKLL